MAYFKNEFRSVLYVDDFEASTKFYGEGLELRSNYSWDDGPDDRGVKYLAAGGVIEVIRRDPPIAQGSTTLMLEAEDVNACYQAMKKKDWLIFLEDLADRPYGIRCFRLLDPNKNDIVIFSYLKDMEEKGLLGWKTVCSEFRSIRRNMSRCGTFMVLFFDCRCWSAGRPEGMIGCVSMGRHPAKSR